ncbi:cellulase family glycosylhydrolase [Anaerosporobacter sp.]|uniref:cellulase family glycosylhydrolase n=1 Tax=Anaerosporobacter sp. TaxID=1872529 RepID=UPI00286EBA93|nr:cellulase family glycosylhydrolase [Anaerosporobacter sp.]
MKRAKKVIALLLAVAMVLPTLGSAAVETKAATKSASQAYVDAMQPGYNLGNSFDAVNTNLDEVDTYEAAWGNAEVTKEQIQYIKDQGFNSIRIPLTLYRRISGKGSDDTTTQDDYIIDETFLDRYAQVVDWALEADLYVMVNVHHDSWLWLNAWDGNVESDEYIEYVRIWEQLSAKFKDYSSKVCFETINEPRFDSDGETKIRAINNAAYKTIRKSGGANVNRMIVIPALDANGGQDRCDAMYEQITVDFNQDKNIIATFHYYSEWVYSANLGKTGFDEVLWNNTDADGNEYGYTPRIAVDQAFDVVYNTLTANGIGVICGEYGLLGHDQQYACTNNGEENKYLEYINYVAYKKGITLMLWDNGTNLRMVNRSEFKWRDSEFQAIIQASMKGRSSYATGLEYTYVEDETKAVEIPLTLNGNKLVSLSDTTGDLVEGKDYTYENEVVTLTSSYIKKVVADKNYGLCEKVTFKFTSGANWIQKISKVKTPEFKTALKSYNKAIVNIDFGGNQIQKMTAYQASGKVGPQSSWWGYLQYSSAYVADYSANTLVVTSEFFNDGTVQDGKILLECTFYNGEVVYYVLNKSGKIITGSNDTKAIFDSIVEPSVPENVTLYAGEQDLSAYVKGVKGFKTTGSWAAGDACYVDYGNNNKIVFSDKAAGSTMLGFQLQQYNSNVYLFTNVSVVKAPSVSKVEVAKGKKKTVTVKNLAKDAVVTYKIGNKNVATVTKAGVIKGVKKGKTTVSVTVSQYGRKDTFKATVVVK